MAGRAEGLPVALVPEESLITSMRDDMVYHSSRDQPALTMAPAQNRQQASYPAPT